ncbi:MAG TPA: DUF4384 domain-containing protein [Gemmatimonadales bacterium]|jgi:hypothetical protein
MLTLLASMLIAAPPADTGGYPAPPADPAPAIQVSLNNDGNYLAGGRADVRVQTNDDGYLLVLRVDGDGQIRVLFPLDPEGDTFVRGGKEYELRGRDDRQTFMADDRAGNGLIYAAISHEPFVIADFSANGHWDYNALRLPDSSTDAENDLTQLVAQMTNHARFEYDAVGYRVQDLSPIASMPPAGDGYYPGFYDPYYDPAWRCLGCGWAYPGSDISFGLDFGYSPFYDPYLFSPWAYNYGYRYGGGFFPGTFPVIINPRPFRPLPPGTRARPRGSMPMPGNGSGRFHPSPSGAGQPAVRGTAPSGPVGTRARPRPNNEPMMPSRMPYQQQPSSRPIFREPPRAGSPAPQVDRRPMTGQPESRPVYREPPRPSSPPPSVRVSPPPRSAPPSGGGERSRPSGGGGGGGSSHGGGGHHGR